MYLKNSPSHPVSFYMPGIIQRVWRRKARRSVRPRCLWPSLSRLKEMYLDEVALAAGADEGEYYTDEMIVRREQLRSSHLVVEALRVAWERIAPIRGVMDFVKRVLCLSFTGCAYRPRAAKQSFGFN